MPNHGEYIKEDEWQDKRWCEICNGYHGQLYQCSSYPPELLKEIEKDLNNPTWVQQWFDDEWAAIRNNCDHESIS